MKMRNRTGRFAIGLIVGSLAGAAAGMMFAPRTGREVRDSARRQSGHYVGTLLKRLKMNRCANGQPDRTYFQVEVLN